MTHWTNRYIENIPSSNSRKHILFKCAWNILQNRSYFAALFTIAMIWKQPKCPSINEWIKKCYTHTHIHTHTQRHTQEYYSAIKKNEILPFAMTWMELESIMLSEISQSKTNTI